MLKFVTFSDYIFITSVGGGGGGGGAEYGWRNSLDPINQKTLRCIESKQARLKTK